MPFERYVTDATDGGVQGVKLQVDGGVIKPLKEVERGLESKYKNQYDTQIGEGGLERMPGERRQEGHGAGKKENMLDHIAVYQKIQQLVSKL
jgi:hypothetical protein